MLFFYMKSEESTVEALNPKCSSWEVKLLNYALGACLSPSMDLCSLQT